MDDPRHVNEAFAIVLDEDEVIPVTLENGEEGYRINPDFDEEG